jgi:hypothetical protein
MNAHAYPVVVFKRNPYAVTPKKGTAKSLGEALRATEWWRKK